MRILVIHNFYKHFGGEDSVVKSQIELLSKKGNDVYLYSKDSKNINPKDFFKVVKNSYSSKSSISDLERILVDFKPDIAHIHNVYPLISTGIYKYLSNKKVPIIQTVHNFRFMCPNGLMFRNNNTCTECLEKNSFYKCTFNKCYRNSYIQSFWYSNLISSSFKKGAFNYINKFIVLNKFTHDLMIKKGYPKEKIELLYNSIDNSLITPNYSKEDYFLYLGRLSSEKGIQTLLDAFAALPNYKLIIAGNGDLADHVKNFIKDNNLNNISFIGFIDGSQKYYLISKALALIIPSVNFENLPVVLLESLACGTSLIVSDIGGLKTFIKDGLNGYKFEPGNSIDLKSKIELYSKENNIVENLSKNSYIEFENNYTIDIQYSKLQQLYLNSISKQTKLF